MPCCKKSVQYFSLANTLPRSEWNQCYWSDGECIKNRTLCAGLELANCTTSTWSDWSFCSYNSVNRCVKTRKRVSECGEVAETFDCEPKFCDSSEYCMQNIISVVFLFYRSGH